MECIAYKDGYKYQLYEEYSVTIPVKPTADIETAYINLALDGSLVIKQGYAWDGPSGPTIDTKDFMRGSLVHDALYQLMRGGFLEKSVYREQADKLLREMCKEDGMFPLRAWWVYIGVSMGGDGAADKKNLKDIIKAPKSCR